MIYFETAILAFVMLIVIISMIIVTCKFIQDMKAARKWKKRIEDAELFCNFYELITGEKHKITVLMDTTNYKFEYKMEDE